MIEIIIGGVTAIIVAVYIISKMPIIHYKNCEYCGRRNYLGTDTNSEFERDHLKQYRCKRCGADLFKVKENEV